MRGRQLIVLLTLICAVAAAVRAGEPENRAVTGLVISVGEQSLEIKRGRQEIRVYWDEATRFTSGGREFLPLSLQVCQLVTATYVATDQGLRLVHLDLLKDSYCAK